MRRLSLPLLLILAFLFGCATIKKSPCEPYRKTINCFYLERRDCRDEIYLFEKKFIERFNETRRTTDHLTVNTEGGDIYNLKYRIDFAIPTIYVDVVHCVNGEVVEEERKYLGGEYR